MDWTMQAICSRFKGERRQGGSGWQRRRERASKKKDNQAGRAGDGVGFVSSSQPGTHGVVRGARPHGRSKMEIGWDGWME
jgi:hypothetical protein